jgi:hypothetical protein
MKSNMFLRARSLCASIAGAQPSPVTLRFPSKFPRVSSEIRNPRPEPANRPKPFFRQWLDSWKSRNAGVPAVNWTLITTKSAPPSSERNQRGNHGQSK